MRAIEFTEKVKLIETINTEGLHPLDWIILYEHELQNTTLLESLDQTAIDYLEGLSSYSKNPVVGNRYVPAFIMLFEEPSNRISYMGETTLFTLIDDSKIESGSRIYTFSDGVKTSGWPTSRLSAKTYSRLYLFSDENTYDLFRTAIRTKFNELLPEATFI